jgi:predicted RNA-binding Zn-ribbon protein involved in translation (DUF1610 family)
MTCNFTQDEDGNLMIICTRGSKPDEMSELKKAMVCRRWEICEKCESHETCQRVLAKRGGVPMKIMAGLIDEVNRLSTERNLLESEVGQIKRRITDILNDLRKMDDCTFSIALVKEMLESLLEDEASETLEPLTDEQVPEWVLPEATLEMCSNCMNEVEIPGDEPSKCPACGEDILTCSTCYDQIDGKKACDWDKDTGCWRFPFK